MKMRHTTVQSTVEAIPRLAPSFIISYNTPARLDCRGVSQPHVRAKAGLLLPAKGNGAVWHSSIPTKSAPLLSGYETDEKTVFVRSAWCTAATAAKTRNTSI